MPTKTPGELATEMLSRQGNVNSPLFPIVLGLTARLEDCIELLQDFNYDGKHDDGRPISPDLARALDDHEQFLQELQLAGLCVEMILKVQRPITCSDQSMAGMVLIYNEDRTVEEHLTLDDHAMEWFGDEFKMYVKARFWADGTLQIVTRTEEQAW